MIRDLGRTRRPLASFIVKLLLLPVLLATSPQTLAADKPQVSRSALESSLPPFPAVPQLASYETLMSLSAADREHYLRQLQILLVDLSSVSEKSGVGSFADLPQEPSSLEQILELFIPRARAAIDPRCKNPVTDNLGAIHCENVYVTQSGDFVSSDSAMTKDQYDRAAHPALYENKSGSVSGSGVPDYADASTRDQCYVKASGNGKYDDYTEENNKCGDKGLQDLKKNSKVRKTGSCIFAGNVSKYDSNGKCVPPRSVCRDGETPSGSGKCADGKKPLKCGAGEAVCSPVTFGTKSEKDPYCVEIGGGLGLSATRGCEISSRKKSASAAAKDKNYKANDAFSPEAYLSNDDSAASEKAWNKLKKGFAELCSKENTVQFARNCDACMVMRRRLMAMNARIKAAKDKTAKNGSSQPPKCVWSADEEKNLNNLKTQDMKDAAPARAVQ